MRLSLLAATLIILVAGPQLVCAGTTGVLAGDIRSSDGAAIGNARVTAISPSASVSVTSDAAGHYVFLSLVPVVYTVTAIKPGYEAKTVAKLGVSADNTRTLNFVLTKAVKVIGNVSVTTNANALVKPGVSANVYTINNETASKVASLGGGGDQDTLYASLAAVPGVFIPMFQYGAGQLITIRGNLTDIGYEYDGIPVNRSFDNAPSGTGSRLGQQQLQAYTGGSPANAESQGLAGFINQVIKSGTYPGFTALDASVGGASYSNSLYLEKGGSTPDRHFTYYVGIGGYDISPRYYDNFDGASLNSSYGFPFDVVACNLDATGSTSLACYNNPSQYGPGGLIFGPFQMFAPSRVSDRETVTNVHFKVPQRRAGVFDDVQILYGTSLQRQPLYSSYFDFGKALFNADAQFGAQLFASPAAPVFLGGFDYQGTIGQPLPNGCPAPCNVAQYRFPSSNAAPFATIPAGQRDAVETGQSIEKLQYQRNIGTSAYLRVYAYAYYSWLFVNGPNAQNSFFGQASGTLGDYELTTHTRGASATYAAQVGPRHLLTAQASFVTANTTRNNNQQFFSGSGPLSRFAVLVDSKAPFSGYCFTRAATLASCEPHVGPRNRAAFLALPAVYAQGVPDVSGLTCDPAAAGVAAGPCEWLAVENGRAGTLNRVRPLFSAFALTDQFKITDKLLLDVGLREDRYRFTGADTSGPGRDFWYQAWNQNECVSTAIGSKPVDKFADLGQSPSAACPPGFVPAIQINASKPVFTYSELQPRLAATYTINADSVLRASYGRFAQPPPAAFEQYDFLQQNLPERLGYAFNFYAYGYKTPGHAIGPAVAHKADSSFEHHFPRTDVSFKLGAFWSRTSNQLQGFTLDQQTGFGSALPAVRQTSSGIEFELQKGAFDKNGLAVLLTYGYTNSYLTYSTLPNGSTFLTPVNAAIKTYNAYTSYCATHAADTRCGSPTNGTTAARCYDPAGNADPGCAGGDIANPYWLAPPQSLLDPAGQFQPTSGAPNSLSASVSSRVVPHVATLVLNYKRDKWAITPALQFRGGNRYGAPLVAPGIDPAAGCSALPAGTVTGDSRYPYGAAGGAPFDATSCLGNIAIPNPFTRAYDAIGAFRAPNILFGHVQLTYEPSPAVTVVATIDNVLQTCWGGSHAAWTDTGITGACRYDAPAIFYAGNFYNPNSQFQRALQFPYQPQLLRAPVFTTLELKWKT